MFGSMGMGGSTSLGIGIAVRLRDHFSRNADRIMHKMSAMHKNSKAIMRDNLNVMRNIGLGMALAGGLGIRAMAQWVKSGAEFKHTMVSVKAVTSATRSEMDNMMNKAKSAAKETVFSLKEIGDSFKFMGMAGMDPTRIIKSIDAMTAVAAAGDLPLEGIGGVSDIMTNIATAFSIPGRDMMILGDILTKTSTSANVNVLQLGESFKYSADVLKGLNFTMEESSAMLAMMGNAGIQGSMAGTALGNTWRQLTTALGDFASTRKQEALQKLGLSPKDLMDTNGELLEAVEIVKILSTAMEGMSSPKQRDVIGAITNIRGARGLFPLFRDPETGKSFAEMVTLLETGSAGEAVRIAGEKLETFTSKLEILSAAWSVFKAEFFESLQPVLSPMVDKLRDLVDWAARFIKQHPGFAKFIALTVTFTFVIGGLVVAFTTLTLLMMRTGVTFSAMKAAFLFGGNKMLAMMGRLIAGQYALNAAGSLYHSGSGRIAKTGGKMAGAGRMAKMGGMMRLLGGGLLRRLLMLAGPIGIGLAILSALPALFGSNTKAMGNQVEMQNQSVERMASLSQEMKYNSKAVAGNTKQIELLMKKETDEAMKEAAKTVQLALDQEFGTGEVKRKAVEEAALRQQYTREERNLLKFMSQSLDKKVSEGSISSSMRDQMMNQIIKEAQLSPHEAFFKTKEWKEGIMAERVSKSIREGMSGFEKFWDNLSKDYMVDALFKGSGLIKPQKFFDARFQEETGFDKFPEYFDASTGELRKIKELIEKDVSKARIEKEERNQDLTIKVLSKLYILLNSKDPNNNPLEKP